MEKFLIVMFYMYGSFTILTNLLMFSKRFRETAYGRWIKFYYEINKLWKHILSPQQIIKLISLSITLMLICYYLIDLFLGETIAFHFAMANVLSGVAFIISFNHPAVKVVTD